MKSGEVIVGDVFNFLHPVLFSGEVDGGVDSRWVVVAVDVCATRRGVPIRGGSLDITPAG